jgi:ATP-dependent Clp protease adaptor protein ClpS
MSPASDVDPAPTLFCPLCGMDQLCDECVEICKTITGDNDKSLAPMPAFSQSISHGIAKGDRPLHGRAGEEGPGSQAALNEPTGLLAEVRLLNDDYTPMEFVVHVLERVFDKDRETATRIMLEIHDKGVGTCGIYPYDAADAKVTEVLSFAREHQHPLHCVLERGSST